MALDCVQVPPDGTGKRLAAFKAASAGPGGTDLYFEIDVNQVDNAVGRILHVVPFQQIPSGAPAAVVDVDVAIDSLFLCNDTNDNVWVSVKTGDGNTIISAKVQIPPGAYTVKLDGLTALGGLIWEAQGPGVTGALKYYTS